MDTDVVDELNETLKRSSRKMLAEVTCEVR